MTTDSNSLEQYSFLERVLRLSADVKPKEGKSCILLIGNIFLILTAYYLIKPVREGWLAISDIQGLSKIEIKAYSAFAQSILLIAILPLYAKLATLFSRRKLILTVGSVFAIFLILFWLAQPDMPLSGIPNIGVIFYLFVGHFQRHLGCTVLGI